MVLTCEELRRVIAYDPETGKFTWKVRTSNRVKVGDSASHVNAYKYLRVFVHGRPYLCHRLAWFYMTGEWPKDQIDHINGVRDDNRFCNLREASNSENQRNLKIRKDNSSGFKGVGMDKRRGKWHARIKTDGKQRFLGYFHSPVEAYLAYCAAAEKYHGEFARF